MIHHGGLVLICIVIVLMIVITLFLIFVEKNQLKHRRNFKQFESGLPVVGNKRQKIKTLKINKVTTLLVSSIFGLMSMSLVVDDSLRTPYMFKWYLVGLISVLVIILVQRKKDV